MPFELSVGLLDAGLGFAVGRLAEAGISFGTRRVRDRGQSMLWSFLDSETSLFVPLMDRSGVGAAGGYGDLLAMSLVIDASSRRSEAAGKLSVHPLQEEFEKVKAKNNIVAIGGGKYSSVYRTLVKDLHLPLHFFDTETESFTTVRNEDRSVQYSPSYSGKVLTHDLGIVVRAPSPYCAGKWIIMAAGSHTYGSAAGIRYLQSRPAWEDIREAPDKNFEVVVRGHIVDHTIHRVDRVSAVMRW